MKFFRGFDFSLPLIVFFLSIFGLALIWSLAPNLFFQQLTFVFLGFLFFFVFAQIDFRIYGSLRFLLYLACLFLLILTFLLGEITRGAVRWIQIGQFTIQASEMVKPFFLCFFAFLFSGERVKISRLGLGFILFLLPAVLIFIQPDLGSTLVLTAALLGILFTLNLPTLLVFAGMASLVAFLPLFWFFLADYQKQRILSFLNPNLDPLGSGYNLLQAVITVGSGQIFGRGLGKGTQSHLAFLPERHTDFIFASLSEELGFAGAMVVLVLYLLLLWRILKICQNTKQDFGRLFCVGIFSLLLFQIFVNVGMNLGLVPITGITLPFLSYGGSSFLGTMIALGMVESIARLGKKQETIEIK